MQLTSGRADFIEIMEMLDKRLNDKGKNWRHVFKVSLSPSGSPDLADFVVSYRFGLPPPRGLRECGHLLPR